MRVFILSFCIGLLSLNSYSQSKLVGAGKASKVGGVTTPTKKTSTPKPSEGKKTIPNKTITPKGDRDSKYESSAYMEITGVKFGNADDDGHIIDKYGAKLYASEVKYLKPQLSYDGLASSEKEITVYVKIIQEDGSLKKGSNSPEGYTYKQELTVKPGSNQTALLSGWGRNSGGSFSPGQYGFEIWYKDKLIFQDGIRLYSGSTPLVSNNIFKINRIAFGSEDADDNINIKMGETLYEGEVKYLIGNMYYEGLYSNDQKVTLYMRIFFPSGSLSSGTDSPIGFTYKRDVTIKSGSNVFKITGWGNKNGTSYKAGKHKYEIWLDGEKIYETTFNVTKRAQSSDVITSGTINGHGYVDLGLPSGTKWATCNIGAINPEDCGNYYAWGETTTKTIYTHGNSKYYNKSAEWLRGQDVIDYSGNLKSNYDPASKYWSSSWRMPTLTEMNELVDKCNWAWTERNGKYGFKVTGPNGKNIFLPASGWYNSASSGTLDCVNERSEYWTSTIVADDKEDARSLFFMKPNTYYASDGHSVQRSRGLCIRPVSK